MTPDILATNDEDRRPLMVTEDTDLEFPTNSSMESLGIIGQPLQVNTSSANTSNPFASFDDVFYHGNSKPVSRNNSYKIVNDHTYFPSVGELLWKEGQMYSDVRLSFEDRGTLAARAGIPTELRLHSLVLFQSQFFKEQLSVTSAAVPSSPSSNIIKEKQIIVRLPSRITEEDIINFYSTLKLMYTKNWDVELANNLTKGVGCLSVCCEIGFHEGIEACWKWLVNKCNRDKNKEMMRRLIEAYPNLHEQFSEPDEKINPNVFASIPYQSSSKSKRNSHVHHRSSRRSNKSRRRTNSSGNGNLSNRQSVPPKIKLYRGDASMLNDSSTSPCVPFEKVLPTLPSPPLSTSPSLSPILSDNSPTKPSNPTTFPPLPPTSPPSIFNNSRVLNTWITNFESYAISSKRACSKMQIESRQDSKCFPFLEHFVSIFDSINQLGRAKRISSPEALDYTLRMLNVIKVEHAHFHTLHMPSQNKQLKPSKSSKSLKSLNRSPMSASNSNSTPPIVLHESLDEPLSQILKNILAPKEQKHLCDFLWAPSNISNLMHLREIRSDDEDNMEEDEFERYDQLMGEISLVKASRVSRIEHMVVGEKMAKCMREIRSNTSKNYRSS
ncbi:12043_t:CDS:2 [Funneliformis mosseae]|uniref:12043_t:CDS:1 n=1 Tax=Funneliformis mosseae TaxID=27381 RepID=A0A9N9EWB3_FUNMO|nr:12043_t:CDS:2 [Funneliformis mosseae]